MDEREVSKMDTIRLLENFVPYNEQEIQDKLVMLKYLHDFKDIFERSNVYAHMCSSPWIMNETGDKVLMIYHNIFDSWSWCGGHCDGDQDVIKVALREGREETGLQELELVSKELLAIDILPVLPHFKHGKFVSAHVHLNTTFLCIAKEIQSLQYKPDENSGVKWIPITALDSFVNEKDMKVVYQKLIEKTKILYNKDSEKR